MEGKSDTLLLLMKLTAFAPPTHSTIWPWSENVINPTAMPFTLLSLQPRGPSSCLRPAWYMKVCGADCHSVTKSPCAAATCRSLGGQQRWPVFSPASESSTLVRMQQRSSISRLQSPGNKLRDEVHHWIMHGAQDEDGFYYTKHNHSRSASSIPYTYRFHFSSMLLQEGVLTCVARSDLIGGHAAGCGTYHDMWCFGRRMMCVSRNQETTNKASNHVKDSDVIRMLETCWSFCSSEADISDEEAEWDVSVNTILTLPTHHITGLI